MIFDPNQYGKTNSIMKVGVLDFYKCCHFYMLSFVYIFLIIIISLFKSNTAYTDIFICLWIYTLQAQ